MKRLFYGAFVFSVFVYGLTPGVSEAASQEATADADESKAPEHQNVQEDNKETQNPDDIFTPYVKLSTLEGIAMDSEDAEVSGDWFTSTRVGPYVGLDYLHQGENTAVAGTVRYTPKIPEKGLYTIRISYSAFPNRASNTLVRIKAWDGGHTTNVDQRLYPDVAGPWFDLGTFILDKTGSHVEICTEGADGYVIADAVQWILVEKITD